MRPDNAALQLAPAQSGRKEAAKQGKKGFFGDTPNPVKGAVLLCTPPVMSGCQALFPGSPGNVGSSRNRLHAPPHGRP